jgi:hypothetical protein
LIKSFFYTINRALQIIEKELKKNPNDEGFKNLLNKTITKRSEYDIENLRTKTQLAINGQELFAAYCLENIRLENQKPLSNGIVTHETSHSIMLKLSQKLGLNTEVLCDKIQKDVLDSFNLSQGQVTNELSRYAKKSSFDFVVEGLAEFIDSKTPRRVARKIGGIVLAYLKELQ